MTLMMLNPGKKKRRKGKSRGKRRAAKRSYRRKGRKSSKRIGCGDLATMRYYGQSIPAGVAKRCAKKAKARRARKVSRKSIGRRNLVRRSLSGLVCGNGWEGRVAALRRQCGTAMVPTGMGMAPREIGLNPGITSGMKPSVILNMVPIAAGVILNYKVTPMIASRLGSLAQSKVGNVATGLATAGLSLLIPKYGDKLFAGGVVRVVLGDIIPWIKDLISPAAPSAAGPLKGVWDESFGLNGMNHYGTTSFHSPMPSVRPNSQMFSTNLRGPWDESFGLNGLQDLPVTGGSDEEVP